MSDRQQKDATYMSGIFAIERGQTLNWESRRCCSRLA